MQLLPQFVSIGVNRVVNALDWADHGLIAYGGHWIVCIYDPQASEVVGTLIGHKGQVNCVKWLPQSVNPAGSQLLLSGAADNTIRLWAWHGRQLNPPWSCIHVLQAHNSAVTSLAVQLLDPDTFLLASTSADSVLQLWHCQHNGSRHNSQSTNISKASCLQQQQQQHEEEEEKQLQLRFGAAAWQLQPPVHVGSQVQHCVALTTLPDDPNVIVMATGGTDSTIRLFVRESQQQQQQHQFQLQCQLKGHENWVRGVAFTHVWEEATATASCSSSSDSNNGCGQQQQQQRSRGRVSLLLASAAQDRYARLWCICTDSGHSAAAAAAANDSGSSGSGSQADAVRQSITRYAPRPHLSAGGRTHWVSLEALLIGHEDWLHSVTWRPCPTGSTGSTGCTASRSDLSLLTVSQDRSMMLWCFDRPSGLWLSEAAVGDAGTSCLGFYGGAFGPKGDWLVAHGYTGALHLWQQQQQEGCEGSAAIKSQQQHAAAAIAADTAAGAGAAGSVQRRDGLWLPQHALGGHYGPVVDLAWGGDGGCLQSVSEDQTARLFTGVSGHWFELARTQVHGHDFSCLATIATPSSRGSSSGSSIDGDSSSSSSRELITPALLYVSGSEEKVLRVFEAPQAFLDTLAAIRSSQSPEVAAAVASTLAAAAAASTAARSAAVGGGSTGDTRGRALGASVAALGLSNKAVYVEDSGDLQGSGSGSGARGSGFGAEAYMEGPDFVPCAVPQVVTGPPLEEHLAQNTLWPEIRKLYGHGNDVFCVCSSPGGRLLASACKAQSAGAAAVWVWEVGSWRVLGQLSGHTLTVTQLEFSHDGRYLLAGSRDRSFSLWKVPQGALQDKHKAVAAEAAATAAGAYGSSSSSNGMGAAAVGAADGAVPGGGGAGGAGGGDIGAFELVARQKAAHSRIIWGVSWSHDSRCFATGSRDQTVRLWLLDSSGLPGQRPAATLPPFPAGVTAVALAPAHVCAAVAVAADGAAAAEAAAEAAGESGDGLHVVAVGLEDGQVQVWSVQLPSAGQTRIWQLWGSQPWQQHAAAVRRLRWARAGVDWLCGGGGEAAADAGSSCCGQLASCSEDHSVRLFRVLL